MKRRIRTISTAIAGMVLAWAVPCMVVAAGDAPATDLRVLIDVSGSMKENDPKGLRAPGLRLLVGVMPDGSRSGVWTFGRDVEMQVPLGRVDGTWKERARTASNQIHSRSLFTNIEAALRRATFDWFEPDPNARRHLILLTDGMVDVPGDAKADSASRQRIIDELLPRLRAAGVTVHTVALSDNADHKLLKALASATDGWYERVGSADRLNRVFLRLFEKSSAAQQLPIDGKEFHVDASVDDMTVVVFRSKGADPTALRAPDGSRHARDDHGEEVRWHHEQGYDMVTVNAPDEGTWRIQAEEDPDNRVLVMTNLRIAHGPLPNKLVAGEKLNATAWLSVDGRVVRRRDFLDVVSFQIGYPDQGEQTNESMHDNGGSGDGDSEDGVYGIRILPDAEPGTYELLVRAEGETFVRESRHAFKITASPVTVSVHPPGESGSGYRVVIAPAYDNLDLENTSVNASVGPEGVTLEPKLDPEQRLWRVEVSREHAGQAMAIEVQTTADDGSPLTHRLSHRLPASSQPAHKGGEAGAQGEADNLHSDAEATAEGEADGAHGGDEAAAESVNWFLVGVVVVLVNVGVAGAGGGGFYFWRRWKAKRALVSESEPQQEVAENDDG